MAAYRAQEFMLAEACGILRQKCRKAGVEVDQSAGDLGDEFTLRVAENGLSGLINEICANARNLNRGF